MVFKLWSIWHFIYMLSPFIAFAIIYFLVRNRSGKVKRIVGIVLGSISVLILVVRNIDIFARSGWDVEIIPLQVCHIGSLISGLALILRKKWLISTSFCFNLIPAFLAMLFASSLANYDTLLKIRAQAYIWGHFFIIVCALYGILVLLPSLNKRDLIYSISFVSASSFVAIICNSAFRALLDWTPNYFYLYDYKGTPLKFLYNATPTSHYGWFSINWLYTITLFVVFLLVFVGLFFLARLIVMKLQGQNKMRS
ncbi:MAG: YwaF family protein [Clostridia bacterium]|nr:YwaF family protein [Clostridia bacterium]